MTTNRINEVTSAYKRLNNLMLVSYQYSNFNSFVKFLKEEYKKMPCRAKIAFLTILANGTFTYDGYEMHFYVSVKKCVESYKKTRRLFKKRNRILVKFMPESYLPCDDTVEYINFFSNETVRQRHYN